MSEPDQIRAEIELTRGNLSNDVNALTDHVKPSNVAHRQVGKAKGAFGNMRDRVMGVAEHATSTVGDKTYNATSSMSGAASSVSDAVTGAPHAATSHTRGNPMAAGFIALGVGWLLGSVLPASQKEFQAAATIKDNASTLAQPLTDAAKSAAAELKGPAQEAVESVKSTAADAAATVKEEGAASAQDVKSQATDAKETVQSTRS